MTNDGWWMVGSVRSSGGDRAFNFLVSPFYPIRIRNLDEVLVDFGDRNLDQDFCNFYGSYVDWNWNIYIY